MRRKGETAKGGTARSLSLLSRSRNNEKFDLQVLGLPFTMCFNFSPNWIRIAYSQLHLEEPKMRAENTRAINQHEVLREFQLFSVND